jgi:hypothetical protein
MLSNLTNRAALIVLAAAAALAVAATPASATTYHTKTDYLHFGPTHWVAPVTPRVLTLNGTYYWRSFAAHWAHPDRPAGTSRTVTLHGRYRWYDSLANVFSTSYRHTSTFINVNTGGKVTMTYELYKSFGDGSYDWGSTINNIRG